MHYSMFSILVMTIAMASIFGIIDIKKPHDKGVV